jgi:hypothetical protein
LLDVHGSREAGDCAYTDHASASIYKEEAAMGVIKINDLADSVQLDRQAMSTITGGARDSRMHTSFRIRPGATWNRVVDYPGVPVKDVPVAQPGPFTTKIVKA